jgi:DNA-binding XRE family transcriptional regulator
LLQILVDSAQTRVYVQGMDIEQLIAASGKTKRQIAAESGVSRQTIYMTINGQKPKPEVAKKLAMAIGCSVYDIRPDLREIMQ